jgi:8-hydroxy-5-deazaflavin:NADPH oxidoreductase
MKIGILGAGGIGQAFAGHMARAGFEVILSNSRGPQTLVDAVNKLGGKTRAGTREEAAQADVVLLSVPWKQWEAALADLPPWNGRILIDPTNAIVFPEFRPADLNGRTSSEVVASLAPGARVVKACNTLDKEVLAVDPHEGGGRRVLFISGDDENARKEVGGLLEKAGFATIDLGGLKDGGKIQQFGGPLAGLNLIKLG